MKKEEKDLYESSIEKAPADFTSNVMREIEANEEGWSKVLSKNVALTPSDDFTLDLMEKLEGKAPKTPYDPVIPKWFWMTIACLFVGVGIFVFSFTEASSETSYVSAHVQQTNELVDSLANSSILVYTVLGILLLSVALFIEQSIGKKRTI